MKAYLFPGQGSQYVGMGKALYHNSSAQARSMLRKADQVLEMDLTAIMLEGDLEHLSKTTVAQPAIFVYSMVMAMLNDFQPDAVAGHSLGEISALVASRVITFEEGLHLIAVRSRAMQAACMHCPGSMVAVLGLADALVAEICLQITQATVVAANYNCPGQVVISGSQEGIALAVAILEKAGARNIIPLQVEGAFHSPLMASAQEAFAQAIADVPFSKGICPIYPNRMGLPVTDPTVIKEQLLQQLVSPIYWTKTIEQMVQNGIKAFMECGPRNVLQGLIKRINPCYSVSALTIKNS